ncbi:MAG: CbbQ/NirQ/NorQ C-terminal domain-containing protein [Gammaproteobacteria bacterium]|nr:CbbQ/NirQ/NorQ C-terminal domain-containing protein [Gammaproteobacteria bacterium]MBL6998442.1 CbbQ/NirQ/NorQ C-terminal domain-containing protein [Gammaproteobacteria bacterium]
MLVATGKRITDGIDPVYACASATAQTLTDDTEMIEALNERSASVF